MKTIGLLQENFHSEVNDYILEIFDDSETKCILYNDDDKYDNKELYKLKFKNLEIKPLQFFFPDLANKVCDKIIVVSWDNIIWLDLLLYYKNDLIFIAHSQEHVQKYEKYNLNFFSLTPLLNSINYTLPLNITHKEKFMNLLSQVESRPDNIPENFIELFQNYIKLNDATPIFIIGYFLEDNKDIELFEQILQTRKVVFFICVPELSDILYTLSQKYIDQIFTVSLPTPKILYFIKSLNIQHLLFAPPKNSVFYTCQWSGSIAFALNNHLNIIMPRPIAEIYNMQDFVITYDSNNFDIESFLKSIKLQNNTNEIQKFRNLNFDRNKNIFTKLLLNINTLESILQNVKNTIINIEWIDNSLLNSLKSSIVSTHSNINDALYQKKYYYHKMVMLKYIII